jgi:tRNA threonylcarbamoyladenosine biosynthesis protein TsaB
MPGRLVLAIEISNPSSGPRGPVRIGGGGAGAAGGQGEREVLAGPGVALGGDGGLLGAELLHEGVRHDDDLMPAIDRLCRGQGAGPRDLGRIVVSIGPGGYTSLRIAVATAKMIALATGAEVAPAPSVLAAAWPHPPDLAPALVCIASKGETAYAAWLASRGSPGGPAGAWGPIGAPEILGLIGPGVIEQRRPRTIIADAFLPPAMRAAAERAGAKIVEPIFAAASLLEMSAVLEPMDPVALLPLYPREAEAVTQWRRRRGRQ